MHHHLPFVLVVGTKGARGEEYRASVLPVHEVPPRVPLCGAPALDTHFAWSHFSGKGFDEPAAAARAALAEQPYEAETYTVQIEHFPDTEFPK